MAYTYRIWDKASPINSCPADKAAESLGVTADKQLCILSDADGHDCVTQLFPVTVAAADVKAWADKYNADTAAQQTAAAEAAKKPTTEQQLAAMALTQAQQTVTITALQQTNAALMLKIAGGK